MKMFFILVALAALCNAKQFIVPGQYKEIYLAFQEMATSGSNSDMIDIQYNYSYNAQLQYSNFNNRNLTITTNYNASSLTSTASSALFQLSGSNFNVFIANITILDANNGGLFSLSCSLLRIDNATIRRSISVSETANSGYLFQAPGANIVIGELQGTPFFIANKVFSLSNNNFTVYKADFQQTSTQTTTAMISSSNSDIVFGGELTDQQPTVTANLALQVTGTRSPIQIKRGTYTGSSISTALFNIAGNDVIIGQGGYAPRFVNLGTFLLAGRALQIISGTFSRSSQSATLAFSFTQNASVTIGSDSTVPVFDSINSITLNYCRLTINSGNFISASASTYLLNSEASNITIGDESSQAPSFTAQRILNAHFGTSNILKGSFAGIGSANEGNLLIRQSTFTVLDGVPSFTNIDQIVINNSTVNINSGTFSGIGEKPLIATSNNTVLNIGQTTSTAALTFAANQIINTAASQLNIFRGGFSSSSTTLPLIQAITTPITIGTGTGVPTFTAQRVIDILAQLLTISKGTFTGTTALGTYLKTNGTNVTIGATTTGNVPSFTLDQFDIQGGRVEIISAQITCGTGTNSVIKATPNSQVIIGTSTGTPTLTLTAATIVEVASATLTIYRGVFNGATSALGTIIRTLNSQTTYAAPVTPQINGIELIEVDGGTITVQSGYIIKAAERTSPLIRAFNNPTVVIGQQTATGTALTLIGTTILDIVEGTLSIYRATINSSSQIQYAFQATNTYISLGNNDAYPTFNGLCQISQIGNVLNITRAAFSGVNGANPSIRATNSATINVGIGTNTPTFSCSRAIGIYDSVLNIYRGAFSSQTSAIASYVIQATNSAVTVGNGQTPTFTSGNVFDTLNGTLDIISANFTSSGIDVTTSNTVTTIGSLSSILNISFTGQKLLSITGSSISIINGTFTSTSDTLPLFAAAETSITIGEGGLAPIFQSPYQIIDQTQGKELNIYSGAFTGTHADLPALSLIGVKVVIGNQTHFPTLTFQAHRVLNIFNSDSLSIYRGIFSHPANGSQLDLISIRNTTTVIGGYRSEGLEFNGEYVINITRKSLTIQSGTFSRFPATAKNGTYINAYLTNVTIDETTDTDFPTFNEMANITITGEKLQNVNGEILHIFGGKFTKHSGSTTLLIVNPNVDVIIGRIGSFELLTISAPELVNIQKGNLTILKGVFTGTVFTGTDPKLEYSLITAHDSNITVGDSSTSQTLEFNGYRLFDVYGDTDARIDDHVYLFYGNYTGYDTQTLVNISEINNVLIGQSLGNPQFVGVTLLYVTHVTQVGLSIVSGTYKLPEETESVGTSITANNAITTIGYGAYPQFLNLEQLRVINGSLDVFDGLFTGSSKSTKHMFHTENCPVNIIAGTYTTTNTNTPMLHLTGQDVVIGDVSVQKTLYFYALKILEKNGGNNLKIFRGTFDGSEDTVQLISTTASNWLIGDVSDIPIFTNFKLISVTGQKLDIISGWFTEFGSKQTTILIDNLSNASIGATNTVPLFNNITLISVTNSKFDLISGTYNSTDPLTALVKTARSDVRVGGENKEDPFFITRTGFDVTGGSLAFLRGYFSDSNPKFNLIKALSADAIIIGHPTRGLDFQGFRFTQQSSVLNLAGCRNIVIQKTIFNDLTLEDNPVADGKYLTPSLVVFAVPSTQLVINECVFQKNIYAGPSATAGAVFVQFADTSPEAITAQVSFANSQFIDNSGTISGCIVFRSNVVRRITFDNMYFYGNRYSGGANVPKKASGLFTFEDLSAQLGDDPFKTSYAPHRLSTLIGDQDLAYGNMIPFYTSLEGRAYVPYLQAIDDNVFIQYGYSADEDGTREHPFTLFASCLTELPIFGGRITLIGNEYHINSPTIIDNQRKVVIVPDEGKPTFFNQLNYESETLAAFTVDNAELGLSNFNVIQGDSIELPTKDPINYFVTILNDGFLLASNINFDTNNANTLNKRSYIYVSQSYLQVDSSSFQGSLLTQSNPPVQITAPRQIIIRQSNFTNIEINGGNAGAVSITGIAPTSTITLTGNLFENNGPVITDEGQPSYSVAGAIYLQYAGAVPILDLQGNTFLDNIGTTSGAVYIVGNTAIGANRIILEGSSFFNNRAVDPSQVVDVTSNQSLSNLFGFGGVYLHPVEVISTADDFDGSQLIKLTEGGPTTDAYQFSKISATLKFAARFKDYAFLPMTIVGRITEEITFQFTDDVQIQGRRNATHIPQQPATIGYYISGSTWFSSPGSSSIQWLNFERLEGLYGSQLIDVSQGSLIVEGCNFTDQNKYDDASSFAFILSRGRVTTIQNSIFTGGKYGIFAGVTKSAGELYIEKSQFIGISEQTGPFIRLYSLPGKQMNGVRNVIKSTVFSGASFSLEIGQQNAAIIIEEEIDTTQLLLNRFINTQNSQAILITQDRFNVEVVSNEFDSNGQGLSLGGAISIVSESPSGTVKANYNTFVNNKGTRAGVIYTNPKLEATPILIPTYTIQNNFFYNNTVVEVGDDNANDIYISSEFIAPTEIRENLLRSGDSYNAKRWIGDHTEVIVGENTIINPDKDETIGQFENALQTVDFALNSRNKNGNLAVILYRQQYNFNQQLYILDDIVVFNDAEECDSPYYTSDRSKLTSSTLFSNNAFIITSGALKIKAIDIDITSTVSPFTIFFIRGAGTFEAEKTNIRISSTNSKLFESTQAIKLFSITDRSTLTSVLNSTSSLIDIVLNSNSTFEVADSTFDAVRNIRYANIKVESKPLRFVFSKVTFIGTNDVATTKVAQISGAPIQIADVFDHCTVPTTKRPLIQIPGENYIGQYDGALLDIGWKDKLDEVVSLGPEIAEPFVVTKDISYVGERHVVQTNTDAQIRVVSTGNLQLHAITFIQQTGGLSIIYVDSTDAVVVLDDIGFLVANRRLIESGLAELPSSSDRKDLTKIESNKQKIDIDYYLRNLKRVSSSQILINPFLKIESGYSLVLSRIRFGDWITTSDEPLIDIKGQLQNALIENITLVRVGRQYGGPKLLNLNIRTLGEAKISNVVVDGRGWVHQREIREIQKTDKEYERLGVEAEKDKCGKEIVKEIVSDGVQLQTKDRIIEYPSLVEWKHPAIKVKGGKLRIVDSTFVGLGVDGALVLEDVDAELSNTTRFEENDVLSAAKAGGINKKKVPPEYKKVDDEKKNDQFDEDDRQIHELRRYRGYTKNLFAKGQTTLKAWNVSFIGEKLYKKKKAYKEGYPLLVQHERTVKLVGEIGQANNAYGVPDVTYVKTEYSKVADKKTADGKAEKTVQIEIRTKGNLIPGVEWFIELKNKKDEEGSQRLYHYNLLNRDIWQDISPILKLQGWYVSTDENKLKNEKSKTNSYPTDEFGGQVLVRWLSERVIQVRIAHIEPYVEKKSNADKVKDPDSDHIYKDWQLRLGVEKRADQEGSGADPEVKWTNLKKTGLSGGAIAGIVIAIIVVILLVIIIILLIIFREKIAGLFKRDSMSSKDTGATSNEGETIEHNDW